MTSTKIVATLGPATSEPSAIKELILAGADIFRVNMSHGSHEFVAVLINNIRSVTDELDKYIPVFMDLQGPKLRIGMVENGEVFLKEGELCTITANNVEVGNAAYFSTDYKHLTDDLNKGDTVLLDDGKIVLCVEKVDGNDALCKVVSGGILRSRKGVMLPGKEIKVPVLSQKDIADAEFGMSCNVDGFMLSFVQRAGDIKELQEVMKSCGKVLPVISKIESRAGLNNLPQIVKASDGILVARGDLGVELPVWELPHAQAMIIKEAHNDKKPVIVATEMLESMIYNSRPTRAEVSDVAAAVTGGADVVMLSGETAIGKFPAKAVKIMDNTLLHAEKNLFIPKKVLNQSSLHIVADSVSHGAVELSKILNAKAILIYTRSGFTARIVSFFAPSVPIYVFSENGHTARLCNLYRGTFPFKLTKRPESFDHFLGESTSFLVSQGLLSKGDKIVAVNVTGKHGTYDHSNSIKVFVC